MAKSKTVFHCQECGAKHAKMLGQCSTCQSWNSIVEEIVTPISQELKKRTQSKKAPIPLHEVQGGEEERIILQDQELNRVLGGGLVLGSVVLLGGEPGVGKSTLTLQTALKLENKKVLYVSGEESIRQIKLRSDRIPYTNKSLLLLPETQVEIVVETALEIKPDFLIIDSIQTMHCLEIESAPGSVSQIRESTMKLIRLAKTHQIPIFLIGHVNKEGMIAGPKVLEHMVDCVLSFEGDRHNNYRIVRTTKNRFGSTMELGLYEMLSEGLREVINPSEIFLSTGKEAFSGLSIGATMEGMRPLLIEIQALVSPMAYGNAQRSATGFDLKRLNMLLAVLEKKCGFKMGNKDVFINIAGGIKVEDPALDLGIIVSIISSMHDIALPRNAVFSAEVGLTGEIRSVNKIEQRIKEALKLGFEKIYIAQPQANSLKNQSKGIEIIGFSKLQEFFREVFG